MPPTGYEFRRDTHWGKRFLQGSGSADPIVADWQTVEVSHISVGVTSEGLVAEPDGKKWIVAGDILIPATNPNVWKRAQTVADVTGAARVCMSQRTMDMTPFTTSQVQTNSVYWKLRFYDRNVRNIVDESLKGLEPEVFDKLISFGLQPASRVGGI